MVWNWLGSNQVRIFTLVPIDSVFLYLYIIIKNCTQVINKWWRSVQRDWLGKEMDNTPMDIAIAEKNLIARPCFTLAPIHIANQSSLYCFHQCLCQASSIGWLRRLGHGYVSISGRNIYLKQASNIYVQRRKVYC